MNFLPLWKVYLMRFLWKVLFFDPINTYFPCKQKITTYGFNSAISSGWSGYEDLSTSMWIWYPTPWAPGNPTTNYNLAIIRAIMAILSSLNPVHGHMNNCLLLFSDGGNIGLMWWMAFLYKFVVNWVKNNPWNRCTCARCYYVGTSSLGYSQFANVCNQINAPISNGNPWNMGIQLVNHSVSRIFNQGTCYC